MSTATTTLPSLLFVVTLVLQGSLVDAVCEEVTAVAN